MANLLDEPEEAETTESMDETKKQRTRMKIQRNRGR